MAWIAVLGNVSVTLILATGVNVLKALFRTNIISMTKRMKTIPAPIIPTPTIMGTFLFFFLFSELSIALS